MELFDMQTSWVLLYRHDGYKKRRALCKTLAGRKGQVEDKVRGKPEQDSRKDTQSQHPGDLRIFNSALISCFLKAWMVSSAYYSPHISSFYIFSTVIRDDPKHTQN